MRLARAVFAVLVAVAAWEIVARSGLVRRSLFPPPSDVALALVDWARSGELSRDLQASLWRALAGLVIGGAVGVGSGLATGRLTWADNCLSPVLQALRPLPPVAVIPLVIVWLGIGEVSKVFSISFAVFFPVWINTHLGAREIPRMLFWSARALHAGPLAVLGKVVLPGALPYIVAGLRTGVAVAYTMVFVSEFAGASAGIGYQVSVSHLAYRIDRMVAALAVLGGLGAATDFGLTAAVRLAFPWMRFVGQK